MKYGDATKYLLTALVICSVYSCVNHTDPMKTSSKFFVVRYAERYPGFNGHLTWYGRERAGDLATLLRDSGVQRIYVTPYSRTLETADSLRLSQKIDTVVYLLDSTGADLARALKEQKDYGKTVLIVGHTTSVPGILQRLGAADTRLPGTDTLPNLMFEIINDHGHVNMIPIRFGKPVFPDTLRTAAGAAE